MTGHDGAAEDAIEVATGGGSGTATGAAQVPGAAIWLGAAGLIPFAAGALTAHLAPEPWPALASAALGGYGAVILSFMGGCRWGLAAAGMGEGPRFRPLALSVVPALVAWAALLMPLPAPLWLLAAALGALFLADLKLTEQGGAPRWWPRLRAPLTLGAVGSLVAAALA